MVMLAAVSTFFTPSLLPFQESSHETAYYGLDASRIVANQQYWITANTSEPTSTSVWWINNFGLEGIHSARHNGAPFSLGQPTVFGQHAFGVFGVPIPEPTSLTLLSFGLATLIARSRRRVRKTFQP